MNREEILSLDTSRKVFDYVVNHMKTQGFPATEEDGLTCAYRGASGTSCAVGCLILDEEYRCYMESQTLQQVISVIPRLLKFEGLLYALQQFHDSTYNWSESDTEVFSEHGLRVLKEISKTYVR